MALLKARSDTKSPPRARRRAIGALTGELASDNADTRRGAVREIAGHPDAADATADLTALLDRETERSVQEAIVGALTTLANPAALEILINALSSEDAWLRNAAILALQEVGPAASGAVRPLLDHSDPDLRISALVTLAGMRNPEAAVWVADLMRRDTDVNVCATAVETIEQIGDARAIPPLTELAARFPGEPFIAFAVEAVRQRLVGAK